MAVNSIITKNVIYFVLLHLLRVIICPLCFFLWPMMDAQSSGKLMAKQELTNHHLSTLQLHVFFLTINNNCCKLRKQQEFILMSTLFFPRPRYGPLATRADYTNFRHVRKIAKSDC